jgi:hypothetical protein
VWGVRASAEPLDTQHEASQATGLALPVLAVRSIPTRATSALLTCTVMKLYMRLRSPIRLTRGGLYLVRSQPRQVALVVGVEGFEVVVL